ncbi:MAG TPA: CopG family transcriptional regulator [Halanaerobiaceae bacterium]|nr:CopG family transcriptional regulator [Halanaerobiaceae bacterium]HOA41789.1 ribbon-helix-helix protein, CopG family [Halanaerobiales bacterium]HQD04299.1 ribbon-helix-helix protein, CopG family [Halanaerobiales bacterium]
MGNLKRVMISLPNQLLQEVDGYVKKSSGNRSEFIREAMKLYLEEKKKQEIREQMKTGYLEMSAINLQLADEGIKCDGPTIYFYEEKLAESE